MPASAVQTNDPMRRPVLLSAIPAASSPPAAKRSPRLPKIIVVSFLALRSNAARSLDAVLLRVEDPLVALDDDGVAAVPGLAWHGRVPRHRVAEPGVERAEVLGGVDEVLTGEVVQDPALLLELILEITGVVVVDGDEPGDV